MSHGTEPSHNAIAQKADERKTKKPKQKFTASRLILLVLFAVFLFSGYYLLQILVLEPAKVQKDHEEIRAVYYEKRQTDPTSSGSAQTLSLEQLKVINSDIVGWIHVPNTVIDYPVLQSSKEDPEFYLKRNYRKEYSNHGSIFLNAESSLNSGRNLVLYGHSMNDGQMFADLLQLTPETYQNSPVIEFDTMDKSSKWKVISILKTNTKTEHGKFFPFTRTEFASDTDYLNFIYQLRIRSIVNTPVDFAPSDRIVTLSTCSYELDDFRTVVVAREVRPGEDETVETAKATVNHKAVYPDGWYQKYGGTKPDWPETLKEAQANGLIDWLKTDA